MVKLNNLKDTPDLDISKVVKIPELANLISKVDRFAINPLPDIYREQDGYREFTLYVEYRSEGKYAVSDRFRGQLSDKGVWDGESLPSGRSDYYIRTHRFDLSTALKLAEEASKKITIMGMDINNFIKTADAHIIVDAERDVEQFDNDEWMRRYVKLLEASEPDEWLVKRINYFKKSLGKS